MSESTNITPAAAATTIGAAKPAPCCDTQKPAQQQTGAAATNPAANKGFKRQGKKQH